MVLKTCRTDRGTSEDDGWTSGYIYWVAKIRKQRTGIPLLGF